MRTFARVLHVAIACVLLVSAGHGIAAAAPTASAVRTQLPWTATGPDGLRAQGAALADGLTGTVLWSREAHTRLPIASIAKVMTAVVVIASNDLERPVTVPAEAAGYCAGHNGSTAGLAAGEVLTGRQLLYGLLLPSGCDAAYALAEAYGPGQQGFLARMNDTARVMGLGNTHFADPSGLPYPTDHATFSTPADLVALGVRAMALPVFREIVAARDFVVPAGAANREHHWSTTNRLLREYPGTIGIKTGNTNAAGHCLLFETVRAGIPLVGVVLHSSDTSSVEAKNDAERMLNWAYDPIVGALGSAAR
ncbi:D-alanyl-D-alanine carboxypeptidase family protein [Nocardia rhizosphaerae]|uniref:D-alanyl-D-alanine carboxypeptidase family protein n=1 Tax=Nocardia rhizosphaerae TaxID=1691571 RepID=A0ABV8LA43_9NOCA